MTRTGIVLGLMMTSCLALPAQAQQAAFAVSGIGQSLANPPFTLGYAFSLSEAFTASGLGLFDQAGDGLASSHEIGLWDSGGTLLASTTVFGTSGTLIDGFRYGAISPLLLGVGSYTIGATFLDDADPLLFQATVTPLAGVSYDSAAFAAGGALSNPTFLLETSGFFGPNLLLSAAVPEPATWLVMLLGFGAVGGAMRSARRRQRVTVSYA